MRLKYKKNQLPQRYPGISSMDVLLLKIANRKNYYKYKPLQKFCNALPTPQPTLNKSVISKRLIAKSKDLAISLKQKRIRWRNVYKKKRRRSPPHIEYVYVGVSSNLLKIAARHKTNSKVTKKIRVLGQDVPKPKTTLPKVLKKKPRTGHNFPPSHLTYVL